TRFRAWAALPLMLDSRVLGSLAFCFSTEQAFPESDKGFIMLQVQKCAQALERTRLYEAEKVARAASERAKARLIFMVEASALLTSSLDYEYRLENLAKLVVPALADGCMVDIVQENGAIQRMAVLANDPHIMDILCQLRDQYPPTWERSQVLSEVLRTDQAKLYTEITDETRQQVAHDAEHLRLLRELEVDSAMIVPLLANGRTLGVLTLLSTGSDRRYSLEDVA